jgi:hypothetical protein
MVSKRNKILHTGRKVNLNPALSIVKNTVLKRKSNNHPFNFYLLTYIIEKQGPVIDDTLV